MYVYDQANIHLEYNIGTAKELLGELGYTDSNDDGFLDKNGQKLTFNIIVSENQTMRAREHAAERIAKDFASVGIDTNVSILSWQEYQKALGKGDFDLALAGFSMPKDGDISFLVHSKKAKYNYGGYSSAELDQLMDDYLSTTEEAEIKLASSKLQRYFTEELPLISLYFRTNTLVYSSAIFGIESARDMDIYRSIDKWFMYREGDENKVGME
jgi:peptide/nickel transport system substrate-binding protein